MAFSASTRPASVRIAAAVARALSAARAADEGAERCGLLLGTHDGSSCHIVAAVDARNRAARADRFDLDPRDFVAAWAKAERQGMQVVGVWHTHPGGAAVPSVHDRHAAWPEHVHVIVGVRGGHTELRAWRCDGDVATELAVDREAVR